MLRKYLGNVQNIVQLLWLLFLPAVDDEIFCEEE